MTGMHAHTHSHTHTHTHTHRVRGHVAWIRFQCSAQHLLCSGHASKVHLHLCPGLCVYMCRVGQNHTFIGIYGVHAVFLAGTLPYIRSYTVQVYSSGQTCICMLVCTWVYLRTKFWTQLSRVSGVLCHHTESCFLHATYMQQRIYATYICNIYMQQIYATCNMCHHTESCFLHATRKVVYA